MEKEIMKDYTLRISQSNRSGLVLVMYDMVETYLTDAKESLMADRDAGFKENVRNADRVLKELQDVLNFKYEISKNLYSLYSYCRKELSKSLMKHSAEGIDEAGKIITRLAQAFREAAKVDKSKPLMQNTGQVYAGITYGKSNLNENYSDGLETSRGFFV